MQKNSNWQYWHGFKGKQWPLPTLVAASDEACRADQKNTIKANEYLDSPEVLEAKMTIVAQLIRKSKLLTAYTGAGLSKASGIPDYATKAKTTVVNTPKLKSNLDAQPTYAHHILTEMERAGYLKHWVQQNHDGLPQKAGFPQEKINEIHGAWFDPSNPVVQFSGKLRGDLFDWMADIENKIDLCLCLGTSLSGMNADRTARTPAKKSLKKQGGALGTVIINLQQTPLDDKCVIRVWAKLDDAFRLLAEKLEIDADPVPFSWRKKIGKKNVFIVPYDAEGRKSDTCKMEWDLRPGAEVRVPIEGAMNFGVTGKMGPTSRDDAYYVDLNEKIFPVRRLLGMWWVDAALRGAVPQLPVVNISPKIIPAGQADDGDKETADNDDEEEENENENKNKNENENGMTNAPPAPPMPSSSSSPSGSSSSSSSELPTRVKIVQSHWTRKEAKGEDQNTHKWGLRLEPGADRFVSSVTWTLHPSFRDNVIVCNDPPFAIDRLGWGTFTVKAAIKLKSGKVYKAKHQLTFDGEGENVSETQVALSKANK
jgi:NAD-dependent SIR2 family protein deacetylase